jgi:CheY-like chemotaxis protein
LDSSPDPAIDVAPTAVLVVEDDINVRMVVSEYLRGSNYTVIEAISGDEAVAILASGAHVDIVFTDFRLPGTFTGEMLAEWIGKELPLIPVLLTSGEARTLRGAGGKARRFIAKPYDLASVKSQLQEML